MIISGKHGYLFVEVPQTASTAISRELRQYYGGEELLRKHANYSEFRRSRIGTGRDYFTFATVRNPLDQAVSSYTRIKQNHRGVYTDPSQFARNGGWVPEEQLRQFEWVHATQATFPAFFKRFYSRMYHEWVLLDHSQFDFVMRYENVQEDFRTVLRLLGLEPVRPLPVVNATDRGSDFLQYYTPEHHPIVSRYFGPFLEYWGYEIPKEWASGHVPWSSKVSFGIVERLVTSLARFFPLDPRGRHLQAAKSVVRRFRLA